MIKRKLYNLNEMVFDKLTEESSYWIGMLLSDGCIDKHHKKVNRLTLSLQEKDYNHLVKFKQFLKCDHPITKKMDKKSLMFRLQICSDYLTDKLKYYGIIPNKTFVAEVKDIFKNDKYFWRGMIDGDGSLFWHYANGKKYKPYPEISLVGTYNIVDCFKNYCIQFVDCLFTKIHKEENIYKFRISGTKAQRIIKELYEDALIYLDRKYELAMKMVL